MTPAPDHVEAARLLRAPTAWERRLRHFDVLCDAGVSPDRALEIIDQADADRAAIEQELAA